jgi:enoyl-CoA hydratase/carnithine racemase
MAKRLLRESERQSLESLLDMSATMQSLAHHTKDHKEAISAALEKRTATFTGE